MRIKAGNHPRQPIFQLRCRRDQRDTNIRRTDIAVSGFLRQISARQHPQACVTPKRFARRRAIPDIEPEKKSTGRAIKAKACAEQAFGQIQLGAIGGTVVFNMGVILPS